jgi:ParB-like chromosome segregation protein Spo0J
MIEEVNIKLIIPNPSNPRIIKDTKFVKLVKSIKDFPEMLALRPIVVDEYMIVLGGNMRLKACIEAGLKRVPIIKASMLTADQQKEFIIKDNVGYGEWDWDILANQWDEHLLNDWGLEVPVFEPTLEPEPEESPVDLFLVELTFNDEESRQKAYTELIEKGYNVRLSK